jgi:PHD/YefM family antitoxin component YafN of YafNO toxin-antitoxin module
MTAKLREPLSAAVEKVKQTRRRLPIRRNGKIIGAVVSADDLEVLEEIDRQDLATHRKAMARVKNGKEKLIPWSEVKRKLRL